MNKSYRDLFKGTAPFYARYRYQYSSEFFRQLAQRLQLNGQGRLLDLGCGTGQLIIPLAAYFEEAVGLDPEPEMLEQAAIVANEAGVKNVRWVEGGSADLPGLEGELGMFTVVAMGNSFHWMNQTATLAQLDRMVVPGGRLAITGTSSGGVIMAATEGWAYEVQRIVRKTLGETRRAGSSTYQGPAETFEKALALSPFSRVEVFEMEDIRYLNTEEIIGLLYSTSYSSKAVLGEKQAGFEREVRETLLALNPADKFRENISIGTYLAARPAG